MIKAAVLRATASPYTHLGVPLWSRPGAVAVGNEASFFERDGAPSASNHYVQTALRSAQLVVAKLAPTQPQEATSLSMSEVEMHPSHMRARVVTISAIGSAPEKLQS